MNDEKAKPSDYVTAHNRLLLAAATAIIPQLDKTSNEFDLVAIVIGLILVYVFRNNPAALRRIYGERR